MVFRNSGNKSHRLQTTLQIRVNKTVGGRLLHRYERIEIDDFHYAGIDQPLIGDILTLGAIPEDFSVHFFGVLVQAQPLALGANPGMEAIGLD